MLKACAMLLLASRVRFIMCPEVAIRRKDVSHPSECFLCSPARLLVLLWPDAAHAFPCACLLYLFLLISGVSCLSICQCVLFTYHLLSGYCFPFCLAVAIFVHLVYSVVGPGEPASISRVRELRCHLRDLRENVSLASSGGEVRFVVRSAMPRGGHYHYYC